MVNLVKQNLKENKKKYNEIVKKLRLKINKNIPIDHVGSTVIPNMYGKNIIDILIGAKDLMELEDISNNIISMGFYPSKKNKEEIYRFFSSTQEETKAGDIHIHLSLIGTDRYQDFIRLKTYLINNKNEAKNYSKFKRDLITAGFCDRKEYKNKKSKYVNDLIMKAKENR